jgi:dephospho-CoA kinase
MGAGKSTALELLEELGAAVLSSDAVVHELYAGDELRDAVVARWGAEVAPGGVVDRAAIARRAFAREEERRWLEGLLWPLVGERVGEWLARVRASGDRAPSSADRAPAAADRRGARARAAVVEVPLLFESGMEGLYDATIAVISGEEVRQARARERGHALAEERAAQQLGQAEKARRATFVVRNDGTREELRRELSGILDKLAE